MRRTARIQNELYTIFRSRLYRKTLSKCGACHKLVHRFEATCSWCGANRKMPITGATQRLPSFPALAVWYHQFAPLMFGLILTLLQARVWLWLWPQAVVTIHAGEPPLLFYSALVIALGATIFLHFRLIRWASIACISLLGCWIFQAFTA
jgi:hypothetical protein